MVNWYFLDKDNQPVRAMVREANQILTQARLPSEHERRLRPLARDYKSKELKVLTRIQLSFHASLNLVPS